MTDFDIVVEGKEYKGQLHQFGFSYRIVLFVDNIPICFEPDEERNFRAIVPPEQMNKVDARILQLIAEELESALK